MSDDSEGSDLGAIMKDSGGLLPMLGWNKSDVKDFQNVWATMKDRSVNGLTSLGAAILIWIIENVPDGKDLFHVFDVQKGKAKGATSVVNEKFMRHALNISHQLDKIIASLDDSAVAHHMIKQLAKSHVKRNIKSKNFAAFRDKFHLLLYDLIRAKKNSKASIMWRQFLKAFVSIYEEEEKRVQGARKKWCCVIQ